MRLPRTKLTPDIVDRQNKTTIILYVCVVGMTLSILQAAGVQIISDSEIEIIKDRVPVISSIYEAYEKNLFSHRDTLLLIQTVVVSFSVGTILIGKRLYLEFTNSEKTKTNVTGLTIGAGFLVVFVLLLALIRFNPSAIHGFNPRYGVGFNCALLSVFIGSGLFMIGEFFVQLSGMCRAWLNRH